MQVLFKRTAFIDGTRYRAGLREYTGERSSLPPDAEIDGKVVGPAPAPKPSSPVDEAALHKEIEAKLREDADFISSIEEELRPKVREELLKDESLRKEIAAAAAPDPLDIGNKKK